MKLPGTLNEREQRFVGAYIKGSTATRAAVEAGYSEKTGTQQASRLLTRPKVRAEIERCEKEIAEMALVDAAWTLRRAVQVFEDCVSDIRTKNGQFNSAAANAAIRALELICKHRGVRAFAEDEDQGKASSGKSNFEEIQAFILRTMIREKEKELENEKGPPPVAVPSIRWSGAFSPRLPRCSEAIRTRANGLLHDHPHHTGGERHRIMPSPNRSSYIVARRLGHPQLLRKVNFVRVSGAPLPSHSRA